MPKKKKKKFKWHEWNQSPDVSNNKDPSLVPKKVYDDPKHLQAAVALAMKSSLMKHLHNLISLTVSLIYKLEVRIHLDKDNDMLLPTERPIIFDEDLHMETMVEVLDMDKHNYINELH
uniref:Uncharacterized protein n=1 Tax=Romanomermis culicivorax TaxID=13658 RepID=A0A915HR86_ROMCU